MNGIHSKLVSIMKERLMVGAKQFAMARSDDPLSGCEDGSPAPILEQISKQLQTLSRVLIPLLLQSQIQDIFTEVAQTFSDIMTPVFKSLQPKPEWDKETTDLWCRQWVLDCTFLVEALENLPLSGDVLEKCLGGLRGVLANGPLLSSQSEGTTIVRPSNVCAKAERTEDTETVNQTGGSRILEASGDAPVVEANEETTIVETSDALELKDVRLDAQPL